LLLEAQLLNIAQRAEENFRVCQTLNLGESQNVSMPVHLAYVHHDGIRNACPNSSLMVSSAELTCSLIQRQGHALFLCTGSSLPRSVLLQSRTSPGGSPK